MTLSRTIVTQVQAEVQAAFDRAPWILLVKKTESIVATIVTINVKIKAVEMVLSLRWGCREHFVSGCWHSLWARLRSLLQGVLVIYFGSAASWRPCNVVRPHQGPFSHSRRLYGRPSAQCNVVTLGTTRVMYWCHVSDSCSLPS